MKSKVVPRKNAAPIDEPDSDDMLVNSAYQHVQLILLRMGKQGEGIIHQMIKYAKQEIGSLEPEYLPNPKDFH